MEIDIIIPTKNRKNQIFGCLESIIIQTILPNKVIIIDQSNLPLLNGFRDVINIFGKKGIILNYGWNPEITGLTQARNMGIIKSSADIILFLDDDVILEQNYIEAILEIYKNDNSMTVGGVGGRITNFEFTSKLGFFSRIVCHGPWENEYNYWYNDSARASGLLITNFLSGCNMSYRKDVLEKYKFDERLKGISMCEDQIYSYIVSRHYRLFMTGKARLQHLVSPIARERKPVLSAMSIANNHYFYKKYLQKNMYNVICYILRMAGFLITSLLSGNKERIYTTCCEFGKILLRKSQIQ